MPTFSALSTHTHTQIHAECWREKNNMQAHTPRKIFHCELKKFMTSRASYVCNPTLNVG